MALTVQYGLLRDLSISKSIGGKSISYVAEFCLENQENIYIFRSMPEDSIESPDDYLKNGDKIGLIIDNKSVNLGTVKVVGIKNFSNQNYFYQNEKTFLIIIFIMTFVMPIFIYVIFSPVIREITSNKGSDIFLIIASFIYISLILLFTYGYMSRLSIKREVVGIKDI